MRIRLQKSVRMFAISQLAIWSLGCSYPQVQAIAATEARSRFPIPEYILPNANGHLCVLKVSLMPPDISSRRKAIIGFITTNYRETRRWQRKFAIAGIDYAAYRYFYVLGFDGCFRLKATPALLKLNDAKVSVDQSGQHLVTTVDEVKKHGTGLPGFLFYRSPKDVSKCLLRMSSGADQRGQILYEQVLKLWAEYRLPLADVTFGDNTIYVLFSRQCSAKKHIIVDGMQITGVSPRNFSLSTHLSKEEIAIYAASQGVKLPK